MLRWGTGVVGFAVMALLSSAGVARAAQLPPPASDACHHHLPNGATIHHPSGEVYLDGEMIAVYPDADCAQSAPDPDSLSAWATWIDGTASTSYGPDLQSPAEYDGLNEYWVVGL